MDTTERAVGRGRDRRLKKPKADPAVRARADELIAQGMPYQMAMSVAHGHMTLNEALERMARKDKVTALMERHTLSRALATQVALGQADLEQVLARRRLEEHRALHRDRTCLVPGARLTLALHDGRALKGTVISVDPYQFAFESDGKTETYHKLLLTYAYATEDWKAVKKGVRAGKGTREGAPAVRPQDRYSCSDRRLFAYMDRNVEVNGSLNDGSVVRGHIEWFGRYEFGFRLRSDASLVVFRHALRDLAPAEGSR